MKIKYGGLITDGRGSIAGNTFSRNHAGAYVRARVTPYNPNTAAQQLIRASVAWCSDRWANVLSHAQRAAWALYAANVAVIDKLGQTMYLTGYNMYMRTNIPLKAYVIAAVNAGPVVFELPNQDPTLAIACEEGAQTYDMTFDRTLPWAEETGAYLHIWQGNPQNAQRNYFDGPYTYIGSLQGDDAVAPASPFQFGAIKAIATGQHLWIRCRIQRLDGRLSEPFRAETFCVSGV